MPHVMALPDMTGEFFCIHTFLQLQAHPVHIYEPKFDSHRPCCHAVPVNQTILCCLSIFLLTLISPLLNFSEMSTYFPGLCFLRGGGFPLSYLSLDGTGGFGIIANCSPRDLKQE